jgi:small neutral amino acid transporter SnatA (MarC family)
MSIIDENTSDEYHTVKELYEFRFVHLIALFVVIGLLLYCLFIYPVVDKALFPYDGHTGVDVIKRLLGV